MSNQGNIVILAFSEYGVYFEKNEETEDELKLYISTPEHSYKRNSEGVEMAGLFLAKRVKQVLKDQGVKRLTLLNKIRKGEYWDKAKEVAYMDLVKRKLYKSQH